MASAAGLDVLTRRRPQECDLGQQSVLHAVQLVHRAAGASAERTASESEPLNKTITKILDRQETEPTSSEHLRSQEYQLTIIVTQCQALWSAWM